MDIDQYLAARMQQVNNTIQARMQEIASSTGILFSSALDRATKSNGTLDTEQTADTKETADASADSAVKATAIAATASRSAGAYSDIIENAAAKYGVDSALIKALIKAESSYRADAVSPKGAIGLMQLMPATAEAFGVENPYDPEQNIDGGVRVLAGLLNRWQGDVKLALASYNCGTNGVIKRGITDLNDPSQVSLLPKETQNYLDKMAVFVAQEGAPGLLNGKIPV